MTSCFRLVRTIKSKSPLNICCAPCVYFSKNLDTAEYPVLMDTAERCGLGFVPGDAGCGEMRTDNCSARKK